MAVPHKAHGALAAIMSRITRRWYRFVAHRPHRLGRLMFGILLVVITEPIHAQVPHTTTSSPNPRATPTGATTARILHRRLPPEAEDADGETVFIYNPLGPGQLPEAIERDGQLVKAPKSQGEMANEQPVHGNSSGAEGKTSGVVLPEQIAPDRQTQRQGTLEYHAIFDPSVLPFKRGRVLNEIMANGELRLARGKLHPHRPRGNEARPGREAFFASIVLEGEAGELIPIPSVAPAMEILSFQLQPQAATSFLKDEADNLYVRVEASGRHQLVMVVDAPSRYFGRTISEKLPLRAIPQRKRPRLPRALNREAAEVIRALGLKTERSYRRVVNTLVAHFRSFEPGASPRKRGHTYLDLALGSSGICRHRSYAFMITASALGIPTRYVMNEAHVFVEIWVPGTQAGWLRVDLGGGAERLIVHGGEDRTMHQPRVDDSLSQPENYANQLARGEVAGAQNIDGLEPVSRAGAEMPAGSGRDEGHDGVDPEATHAQAPSTHQALITKDIRRAGSALPGTMATEIVFHVDSAVVFRGETITIRGRVQTQAGEPVGEGEVQILIVEPTTDTPVALVGAHRLSPEGRFSGVFQLAKTLRPGSYEIIAEFLGHGPYAPARSD